MSGTCVAVQSTLKSPDLSSMCTNTSINLVVKMKFISSMVLKCGKILWRALKPKLQVVKNICAVLMSLQSVWSLKP